MRYALFEGQRILPLPNKKAICPLCNSEVLSKCGKIKVWHWAHVSIDDCDSFGEPEGEWHLNWKSLFPESMQEVTVSKCISDYCYNSRSLSYPYNGPGHAPCDHKGCADCVIKAHRADIRTKNGLVVELQHSPISVDDIRSREEFYNNMVWLLDSETFGKNIHLELEYDAQFRINFSWNWFPKTLGNMKKPIYLDISFLVKRWEDELKTYISGTAKHYSNEYEEYEYYNSYTDSYHTATRVCGQVETTEQRIITLEKLILKFKDCLFLIEKLYFSEHNGKRSYSGSGYGHLVKKENFVEELKTWK